MNSKTGHLIKHRVYANDEFMTPPELAKILISKVPFKFGDAVLDPCPGERAFIGSYPKNVFRISINGDFLEFNAQVDWIVTNPPYSDLDRWLEHCFTITKYGVGLLLGLHNITPKRMELANKFDFGLTSIHLCKVFHWFGISAFCIWEKGAKDIITYDRVVWG